MTETINIRVRDKPLCDIDDTLGERIWSKVKFWLVRKEMHLRFLNEKNEPWGDVEMFVVLPPGENMREAYFEQGLRQFWMNWLEGIAHKHGLTTGDQVFNRFGRPAWVEMAYETEPKTSWERL